MKVEMDKGKGEGKRGQGVQMQDKMRRTEKREQRTEKDGHSTVGLQVVTQLGITHGNEGE